MSRFPDSRWLFHPPFLAFLLALIFLIAWIGSGLSGIPRRRWTFDPASASTVVIVSARAKEARVIEGTSGSLEVSAQLRRIPNGYHAREAEGREISAADWPFEWSVERAGDEIRLRCTGEARLLYCHYLLDELEIRAPRGLHVICQEPAADPPLSARH